jgi:hypothetical protein
MQDNTEFIMDENLKHNLKAHKTWMRGLYILIFSIFYSIAEIVLFAVVLFQFLLTLFTAKTNQRLLKLGQSLSTYVYQICLYISFNSNHQPYPFGAWPKGPPTVTTESITKNQ